MKRYGAAAALLGAAALHLADAQVPYALRAEPAASSDKIVRSILFDKKAAENLRLGQQPIYIESITVIGVNPDALAPKKSIEQRFADALNAPAAAGTAGMRMLDTTPCPSLQAIQNNIGSSFVPLTGCPK